MALNIGKGWHGQTIRHSNARKYGCAGGTYKTGYKTKIKLKNSSNPKVKNHGFSKGVEIESKEHPTLSKTAVEGLVRDHLKENPNYYSNPNSKAERYERCVKSVKKQEGVNPYAVCRKSVYGSRKSKLERKHSELKTVSKSKFDVIREERRKGIIK